MSLFKTVGKIGKGALKVLAPTIAGALPGPLGDLAKSVVTEALGLDPKSSHEEIEAALAKNDPALWERVQQADRDFQVQLEKMGIDREKIAADDRASARQRQMAVKDKIPGILAITTVVAWILNTAALFLYEPPTGNKDVLMVMEGALSMRLGDVYSYFFGSSAGSKEKTQLLGKQG